MNYLRISIYSIAVTCFVSSFVVKEAAADTQLRSLEQTGQRRSLQEECAMMPETGYSYFVVEHSGLRLDVSGSSTSDFANVIQSDSDSSSTAWMLEAVDDGHYRIINKNSGKPLIVEGGSTNDFANVMQQRKWTGNDSTHWCFIRRYIGGKVLYNIQNKRSGKSLEINNNELLESGANVYQSNTANRARQRFELFSGCAEFPLNTMYHITNEKSNLKMVVKDNRVKENVNIFQDVVANEADMNDEWYLVPSINTVGFQRIFTHSKDLVANADISSIKLKQAKLTGEDEWCFFRVATDIYEIFYRNDMKKVMEAKNGNTFPRSNIRRSRYSGESHQLWRVEEADDTSKPLPPTTSNSQWSAPITTQIVGAGAFNLPNGKVILFAARIVDDFRNPMEVRGTPSTTATTLWDPETNSVDFFEVETEHDMFCPGTATLENGIMITGGKNSGRTTMYDYATGEWSMGAGMQINRGYHTMAMLGNGDIFTIGGSWSGGIDGTLCIGNRSLSNRINSSFSFC